MSEDKSDARMFEINSMREALKEKDRLLARQREAIKIFVELLQEINKQPYFDSDHLSLLSWVRGRSITVLIKAKDILGEDK